MKSQNKAETTWNIIKAETGNRRKNVEQINNSIFNPNALNNYFLTIAKMILDKIYRSTLNNSNVSSKPIQYFYQTFKNPFHRIKFKSTSTKEIEIKLFIPYKQKVLLVMMRFQ
jgi:hypothetical protein